MEIHYQNSRADYQAYVEFLWRGHKAGQREQFYLSSAWYFVVLGLGGYLAYKYGEAFAACIFVALAGYHLKQNGSFSRQWSRQVAGYVSNNRESSNRLVIDERGLTETFAGIQVHLPWSELHDYVVTDDRLYIWYLSHRAVIVPFRYLKDDERRELLAVLRQHG